MTDAVRAVKTCTRCGYSGPDFYANNRSVCRPCEIERVRASQAKRRAEMGEAAWLELTRSRMRASRAKRGMRRERIYSRAAGRAEQRLIEAHRGEYEHYLAVELALTEAEAEDSTALT